MVVTGSSITEEQAREIILRTDYFFRDIICNTDDAAKKIRKTLNIPEKGVGKWLKKWGYIPLEYISNDWIQSSFIRGCTGWCHPDGTIHYKYNIGKWPTVKEVVGEWEIVAKTFKYLDCGVTLMDRSMTPQRCPIPLEPVPVVSFRIINGKVHTEDPNRVDVHETHVHHNKGEYPSSVITLDDIMKWGIG
jgi:hypothetical protein